MPASSSAATSEVPRHSIRFNGGKAIGCAALIGGVISLGFVLPGGSGWSFVKLMVIMLAAGVALWGCLYLCFCAGRTRRVLLDMRKHPPSPDDYESHGLGPLPSGADGRHLYLDIVKRTVTNITSQDIPMFFYDHQSEPVLARGFNLERRVNGEDVPTSAHTMIGIRRLENLQECIEDVVKNGVPGDLIETGSYLGGATIFMRAVLKAHGVNGRRVIACDTFMPPARPVPFVLNPILAALASIPSKSWRRKFLNFLQNRPNQKKAFPPSADPSDEWIDFVMWSIQHPVIRRGGVYNGLDLVRSNFARYGLLDEQVVFLRGFFSETLSTAPIENLAVMRLDGDTYESTRDSIEPLYPKLSPGGYCIVDDYHAFPDCRRAIDEYRDQRDITDEIVPIDKLAVFWKKGGRRRQPVDRGSARQSESE